MKGGLLRVVVVSEAAAIVQLLTSKDKALLVRADALLVLDLGLDIVNGVRTLNPSDVCMHACVYHAAAEISVLTLFGKAQHKMNHVGIRDEWMPEAPQRSRFSAVGSGRLMRFRPLDRHLEESAPSDRNRIEKIYCWRLPPLVFTAFFPF